MEPFIRKILGQKYGLVNIPLPIHRMWKDRGFSHTLMEFDENSGVLVITPVGEPMK